MDETTKDEGAPAPAPVKRRPPNAGIGRPKGLPNKITRTVKEMLSGALEQAGGKEYLLKFANGTERERIAFLSAITKLIPTEITGPEGRDLKIIVQSLAEQARNENPSTQP